MLENFIERLGPGTEAGDPMGVARLAVYDSLTVAPRVIELSASDYDEFINLLAVKTYHFAQEKGGKLPFTIIKEVIENLIHAYFKEVVITVFDGGNTIRISDQGPGIANKEKAFEPGFSTATGDMKRYIKGVGSGLPIVRESLTLLGGAVTIEDNLSSGTVVTIKMPPDDVRAEEGVSPGRAPALSYRQKALLSLLLEMSTAGPSVLAKSLGISLTTVYRDLLYLEEHGLVECDTQGKRSLTRRATDVLAAGFEEIEREL